VNLPTVVMLLHPHCPCSRASIEELSKLMTHCAGKLSAKVIAIRPAGVTQGWEQTDLARSAAAIPGVEVVADDQGREAQRFGGATSGQTLLFAADGRLLFAGGITESRGHIGDNAGRSAIEAIVLAESNDISTTRETNPGQTPVFGCPLFSERRTSSPTGNDACHIRN
jgi:hypothetical protein